MKPFAPRLQLALSLISSTLVIPTHAWAAACCGAHAAVPALVTGYEDGRFNVSASNSRVIGDAPAEGLSVFRDEDNQTATNTLRLSGAGRLSERWQAGLGLSAVPSHGLGDLELVAAVRALDRPEDLSLSPDLYLFSQLTAPTGRSIYETGSEGEAAITGEGFWRLGTGVLAVSLWRRWDFYALGKASWARPRSFTRTNGQSYEIAPGWGADATAGLGYSITGFWRVGGSVQSSVKEGPETSENGTASRGSTKLVWPVSLQLTHFLDMNSSFTLTYSDETLLGPVRNITLSRALTFQYSLRWSNAH